MSGNMNVMTVSTQQLRRELPRIREGLRLGKSYLLIHRSKPIAEIRPVKKANDSKKLLDGLLNIPKEMQFKSKLSSVELIRRERR